MLRMDRRPLLAYSYEVQWPIKAVVAMAGLDTRIPHGVISRHPPTSAWNASATYLCLLARTHLHPRHHRRLDPSDVAQQTLLDAHEKRAQFRGSTDAEAAQWLRQILVHNIADAIRAMGAAKRDIAREQSLEATIERSFSSAEQWLVARPIVPQRPSRPNRRNVVAGPRRSPQLPDRQRDAVVLHHLQG